MFQNLKVDIIYYKTNTDFEMEFNLCGCCRMRLLTDKSPDRKTALHSLSRAVSRSRIIIITGGLFGEDGIINMISSATGIPLAELEKSSYGISGDEKIEILKGATPLVTVEGYFGGLIIERGPQTMILVSENKNIRKNIMQHLIHPYVEELCAVELKEKAAAITETNNAPKNEESDIDLTDSSDENLEAQEEAGIETVEDEAAAADIIEEATNELTEENFTSQETAQDIEQESDNREEIYIETQENFVIDTAKSDTEVDAIISSGIIFDSNDDDIVIAPIEDVEAPIIVDTDPQDNTDEARIKITEEYLKDFFLEPDEENSKRKLSFSLNKVILVLAILLLIVFAVLCFCIFYIPSSAGMDVSEYLSETFNTLFGKL